MLSFRSIFTNITRRDILDLERQLGLRLPTAYRSFLLSQNGGQPSPNEFYIPGAKQSAHLDLLYGIAPTRCPADLESEYVEIQDRLPCGYIPIGHDPGANSILISTKDDMPGQIFYWDSESFFDTSDDSGNTYLIADGIVEFLQSLK